VTEPPLRAALRLDIFIEILLRGSVNTALTSTPDVFSSGAIAVDHSRNFTLDYGNTKNQNIVMNWGTAIPVLATVLVAASGYVVTYLNNLRLSQRKERLERIDRQLRELYGPLFALTITSEAAWKTFRSIYRPGGPYWDLDNHNPPNEREAAAWRLWIAEVFMPINEQMVLLIQEHADLLEEPEMPDPLIQLAAHVAGYRFLLKAWEAADYSRHVSPTVYPKELKEYTQAHYERLQRKQAETIGTIWGDRSGRRRPFG
jgi:hypothetical protein